MFSPVLSPAQRGAFLQFPQDKQLVSGFIAQNAAERARWEAWLKTQPKKTLSE